VEAPRSDARTVGVALAAVGAALIVALALRPFDEGTVVFGVGAAGIVGLGSFLALSRVVLVDGAIEVRNGLRARRVPVETVEAVEVERLGRRRRSTAVVVLRTDHGSIPCWGLLWEPWIRRRGGDGVDPRELVGVVQAAETAAGALRAHCGLAPNMGR
jgi:hypothetical protein